MKSIYKIFFALLVPLCFTACDDGDDSGVDYTDGPVNRWVYDVLGKNYLWNDEVNAKDPDYSRDYDKFFRSMLSKNDGKHEGKKDYYYSYIQKLSKVSSRAEEDLYESSFGFDFILTQSYLYDESVSDKQVFLKVYATVGYVIPDSPADKKGLKRGDFIGMVDRKEIPTEGYGSLVNKLLPESATGQKPGSVTVTKYVLVEAEDIVLEEESELPVVRRIDMEDISLVPEEVSTNPVLINNVYTVAGGKKVGYLFYSKFEFGSDKHEYDNELKRVIGGFAAEGVTELVLDLRYNPGGYVLSCQLLSSMLAPASSLGSTFQLMKFNSPEKDRSLPFLRANEMRGDDYGAEPGANLNLSKVYVIATHASASASEALIHCLRGTGMQVYHIGNKTEGKNVGMSHYSSDGVKGLDYETYSYEMWPVTFSIYNGRNETYSPDGIDPAAAPVAGYTYYEDFDLGWKELGDEEEPLLGAALKHIADGAFPSPVVRSKRTVRSGMPVTYVRAAGRPAYEGPMPVNRNRRDAFMKERGRNDF